MKTLPVGTSILIRNSFTFGTHFGGVVPGSGCRYPFIKDWSCGYFMRQGD